MIKSILFFLIGFFCSITTIFSQQSLRTQLLGQFDPPTSDLPDLGGNQYNDVWGYVSPAGKEIAILGHNQYTLFVDVSNPTNPTELFRYAAGSPENWRDYKTYDEYVYGVCDSCNEGLGVYDLSGVDCGDPIQHVRQITTQFGASHNIYIDEPNARLYAVGMPGSNVDMYVYNLAVNPANPPLIGSIDFNNVVNNNNDYYIHDVYVRDNIAYASHGNTGFYIWDVSNLSSVSLIAEDVYNGYNHSSWVTEDGDYAIVAEEVPTGLPLVTVDLRNMFNGNIQDIDQFSDHLEPSGASTAHNPYIRNDYAFISYYHDGLKVYDYSNPSNPVLYAYYDTYASNGNSYPSGYAGAWGCYPYFPSGNILVSDRTFGLHIISVDGTETCSDGIQNQDETGVDCGGKYCLPCISCADGIQNQDETGIDCGGSQCCACPCVDTDGDSVCDDVDQCPGFDDTLIGSSCDDGDPCTTGEKYDTSCDCSGGVFQDFDNDGICDADEDCTEDYVSDLNPVFGSEVNGFGPIEFDMSNGESLANDGSIITINGNTYAKGLGVHADSSIEYDISGLGYIQLTGVIGVDDECVALSSIQFQVYGDDNLLYESPVMTFEDDAIAISIDVQNVNTLRLIVNDAGDGISCDHGNWADLKLIACVDCIVGVTCNDNDACTTNDVFDSNCDCVGTYTDSDNDNVCDANDACPGFSDSLIGTSCNDGDPCTTGEVYNASCICSGGVFQDSDNDGVCDFEDVCEGGDDTIDMDNDGIPDFCDTCNITNGSPCNDGNTCTTNDVYTNCNCAGTYQDTDNDGVCDADDICAGGDDSIDTDGDGIPDFCDDCNTTNGTACNDGDLCTTNDVFINCNCTGTFQDTDNDGVCDDEDICAGGDDLIDTDGDGTPDFCDDCNITNGTACNDGDLCTANDVFINCNCTGAFQDTDNDGICDTDDICAGGDDTVDSDGDGIPDFCDTNCLTLASDDFEISSGSWMSGGIDAERINSPNSPSGAYSMRIRDNSFNASAILTTASDYSAVDGMQISFAFQAIGMEDGKYFMLEMSTDGGNTFSIIEEWISGSDFSNNIIYTEVLDIDPQYLSNNTVIQFRCNGTINSDEIYLDNISLESCLEDSNCEDYITENQNSILSDSQSANLGIETNGTVTTASNIEYTAGEYILLNEGFEVKAQASFHAFIEACQE